MACCPFGPTSRPLAEPPVAICNGPLWQCQPVPQCTTQTTSQEHGTVQPPSVRAAPNPTGSPSRAIPNNISITLCVALCLLHISTHPPLRTTLALPLLPQKIKIQNSNSRAVHLHLSTLQSHCNRNCITITSAHLKILNCIFSASLCSHAPITYPNWALSIILCFVLSQLCTSLRCLPGSTIFLPALQYSSLTSVHVLSPTPGLVGAVLHTRIPV